MPKGEAEASKVIAIVGTLDTKEIEAKYLRNEIAKFRHATILIDVSLRKHSSVEKVDVTNDEVAESAGSSIDIVAAMEKGEAIQLMTSGASRMVENLWNEGRLNGIIGYGGSVGLALTSSIMKTLPMGVPKLIVTTVAASAGKYIGAKDIVIFPSVTDLAGGENINRIEAVTLANAAGAISGMVEAEPTLPPMRPLVVASQFGVTTPHVQEAKKLLEERGYEVIAFHAVGTGGQSLEELVRSGAVAGVLDVTTHELADELVGGVCRAGPQRLEAAGEKGIPQVIFPGALDMVNFFEPETVPKQFETRRFYYHNPKVTLMRTTIDECVKLARIIADKINKSKGPTVVILPMKGWSEYDKEEGVETVDYHGSATGENWHDAEADAAFGMALEQYTDVSKPNIEIIKVDCHINDAKVARLSASLLDDMIRRTWTKGERYD
jgi:uncharacterized protein (UPF0261 family)